MEKIYSYLDDAKRAYLLKSGSVFFEIKAGEYYKITGKNLIIGAGEIIMNFESPEFSFRAYNFYKEDGSELAEITPDNLKKLIYKYSIGYNLNIFFAKMIKLTNQILAKRQTKLSGDARAVHEIAKIYYIITRALLDFANKTKFPDITQFSANLRNELIFETGKIFAQEKTSVHLEVKKDKLDEFNISFAPNSIICREGDEGNEMYILNQGRIAVLINENQVAEIRKPGSVIGEIALLLGETRTATLKAIDQVTLSVIKKDNLLNFQKNNEDIFLQIGNTLAKRIHNNFQIIHNIDKQLTENPNQKVAGFLSRDRAASFIKKLDDDLAKIYEDKEYEVLPELIEKAENCIEKFVKKHSD